MQTIPELTIVVPTFNERDNVRPLVSLLEETLAGVEWEVIFVDDDSPDKTADAVRALAAENRRVRVLHRLGRRGLAGASIEGMLASIAPIVAVMDADLQHDETRLRPMLACFREDPSLDIVIASRHVDQGSTGTGLSRLRKWGSDQATGLARRLLGITATDPMSGFFMIRRESFNQVVTQLQTQGFKILADILSAGRGGWKVREIGYTFRERRHGESKMDSAVVLEFLGLLATRLTGGLLPIRFILFIAVGLTGVFVQLAVVRLLLLTATDLFVLAQTIGVLVAMTTNFLLNNVLTYRDRSLKGYALLRGMLSFYLVCSVGAVANIGVAESFYRLIPIPEAASLAGAVIGAVWNFLASSFYTWRTR